MATRQLVVSLKALVAGYTTPMAAAAKATSPVEASLLRVQRAGQGLSKVGSTLTRRLTLPLAAIGGLAVKMALDFDEAMTKVATLTAASTEEVEGMRQGVLNLAGQTARSPKELADGLFVAASATGDASVAMDILERAARAAALGMGDTATIARAAASVVNAFGKEGVDAARATDVLVATAEAGNFSVDQLAGSLGRVLPFARSAGVSIEDVGGAIALMTKVTGDANQAVTATAGLFRAFVGPTKQTTEALADLGLTAEDIRTSFAEEGLPATLQNLEQRLIDTTGSTGAAREALRQIIPDSQAFAAAIEILDADTGQLNATFGRTADATDSLDQAFAVLEESAAFKAKQAFADLQTAMIQLGQVLLPIGVSIAEFASKVFNAFAQLPAPIKQAAVFLGLFLAVLGPALAVAGNVAVVAAKIGLAMNALALSSQAAALGVTLLGVALRGLVIAGIAAAGIFLLAEGLKLLVGAGDEFEDTQVAKNLLDIAEAGRIAGGPVQRVIDDIKRLTDAGGDFANAAELTRGGIDEIDAGLAALVQGGGAKQAKAAFREIRDAFVELGATRGEVRALFGDFITSLDEADIQSRITGESSEALKEQLGGLIPGAEGAAGGIDELTGAFDESSAAADDAKSALEEYADALKASFDPLFAVTDASLGLAETQRNVKEAQAALNEAVAEHGPNSKEAAEAQRDLDQANRDAIRGVVDLESAVTSLAIGVENGEVSADDARAAINNFGKQGLLTKEQVKQANADIQRALERSTDKAKQLDRTDPNVRTSESGSRRTQSTLERLTRAAFGIPNRRNTTVSASNVSPTLRALSDISRAVFAIPPTRTINVVAVGSGLSALPTQGPRQHGGPVRGGIPFIGNEAGEELFVSTLSGRVLSHADSLRAASGAFDGGGGGGGVGTVVNLDLRGAIVANDRQFEGMVVRALRQAGERGQSITVRGRRL